MTLYDRWLISAAIGLVILGLMMVASSSVVISSKYYHQPFHFLWHQMLYLALGLGASLVMVRVETSFWEKSGPYLLLGCFVLLVLVLIPGLGKVVNGSRRWLSVGPIGIQVSELTKLAMIVYLAGYYVRHKTDVEETLSGFVKPMIVLSLVSCLLLLEPDFGSVVVISGTVMVMLFLMGVRVRYYLALGSLMAVAIVGLVLSSPYRLARFTAFLDPWADQFSKGYQLTQSLIAFGRGGFWGVGFGESIQKLFYLPEAHTDFLFAVLGEELGLAGIILVIILYSILVVRGFIIGYNAFAAERLFAAFVAYGLTTWIGLQALINMGVNVGLLPTKGLTLPFISYGGASLVLNCLAVALLLRIDFENRWQRLGL